MRVAALLPAATEIVIALGAGDHLVAVTHACLLPRGLAHLPRVTRSRIVAADPAMIDAEVTDLSAAGAPLFDLDEAALAAAKPDVVLTQAVCDVCAVRETDVRAAASRMQPPPAVTTLAAGTVAGIVSDVTAVGGALGFADEAEELVAGLQSRMAAIHGRLKAARAPRPRVIVLEWTDPPFSAGHWVPDMVHRAGGVDVIAPLGQVSRRLGIDEVRLTSPEAIIVAPCGFGIEDAVRQARSLLADERWAWAQSVPVWALDASRLASSPGTNVVRGIEVLASVMHPSLYRRPSERDAIVMQT